MKANAPFKQPSNRVNQFSQTPSVNIQRSVFNLNHTHKGQITTGGLLVPFDLYECVPGDSFLISPTVFVRMTTQFAPIMDNLYLDIFYFFVPNRLLWTNWQRFMGERDPDPDSSISYTIPVMDFTGGIAVGETADAFGLPLSLADDGTAEKLSALPFRAYHLIWNQWFRDQNLQDSVTLDVDDGPDSYNSYQTILSRGKRHDYFTSALPWPQKGDAVDLPLGTEAPVLGFGKQTQVYGETNKTVYESDGTTTVYAIAAPIDVSSADNTFRVRGTDATTGYPDIYADLSNATAATINQLREAFQIQRVLERDARGGTRYFEIIQSHFGVTDPSSLIPTRPVFLGGSSTPFNQQAVAQTTFQGTETRFDAKGALAANSIFVNNRFQVRHSMTEHGYIMGILNVRADITYQESIDRHWTKNSRYDFYLPSFANLGEQAIESREIYSDGTGSPTADPPTGDWSIFGYIPRFDEMRFAKSMITGTLRSNASGTLDYLHMSQDFASRPTLSDTFIKDDPPIARTVNITPSAATPAFLFDAWIQTKAVRPMPSRGTPGLIDHF